MIDLRTEEEREREENEGEEEAFSLGVQAFYCFQTLKGL